MRKKRNERKGNLTIKLIYILFISVIVVNLSLARYRTTNDATTTSSAANWFFNLSVEDTVISQTFNVNLEDTLLENNNIKSGVIAPGSEGSFTLGIDARGCQVAVKYEIVLSDTNGTIPEGLEFYNSSTYTQDSRIVLDVPYVGIINLTEINTIKEKTIYWKWITAQDTDETQYNNETINIDMNLTGTQLLNQPAPD